MKSLSAAFFICLLAFNVNATPRFVVVTAAAPQKLIHVTTSHQGGDTWVFSVDVKIADAEEPQSLGAYLIFQRGNENLLSTVIQPSLENGVMSFWVQLHTDYLPLATIQVRDHQVIYSVKLDSFKDHSKTSHGP